MQTTHALRLERHRLLLRPLPGHGSLAVRNFSGTASYSAPGPISTSAAATCASSAENCSATIPAAACNWRLPNSPQDELRSAWSFASHSTRHRQRQHPSRRWCCGWRLTGPSAPGEDCASVRLPQRQSVSSPLGHWLLSRAHRTALRPELDKQWR